MCGVPGSMMSVIVERTIAVRAGQSIDRGQKRQCSPTVKRPSHSMMSETNFADQSTRLPRVKL